jgi:hypothetical protein
MLIKSENIYKSDSNVFQSTFSIYSDFSLILKYKTLSDQRSIPNNLWRVTKILWICK